MYIFISITIINKVGKIIVKKRDKSVEQYEESINKRARKEIESKTFESAENKIIEISLGFIVSQLYVLIRMVSVYPKRTNIISLLCCPNKTSVINVKPMLLKTKAENDLL